jgi:hypothetical protein
MSASVALISADRDTLAVTSQTARSMALATPRPTPYYNFHVGECKDLIFGVSLVDYANAHGLSDSEIPRVVERCIDEIDRRGLDTEGIYRVSEMDFTGRLDFNHETPDTWTQCNHP